MGNRLEGKIALVTGAGQGIGEAIARRFAEEGAQVIVSDLNPDTAEAVAKDIGSQAASLRHDVTSEEDWAAAMALAQERFGGLDVLVNNAGIYFAVPLTEMSREQTRTMLNVNVESVIIGTQAAIPLLAARAPQWQGGGSIINLSSVAGLIGAPLLTAYCASKGAVRLFTKASAMELTEAKIRVNSIHPGVIETPMGRDLIKGQSSFGGVSDNEARDGVISQHPIGRLGEVPDISNAALYLASEESAFMTGSEMVVDGGFTAH